MTYTFRFDAVYNNLPFLLEGLYLTLLISALALAFSMALGMFVALGRLSKSRLVSFASATYVELFRDTPVLVQLFWVYYVLPILLGIRIDAVSAAVLGLTLHSTAFLGEIYRAGIQTVPKGHAEAAKVLGLSRRDTFVRIILPQAFRNVLPPLVNNLVDLPLEIFSFVALMYFLICWPLSLLIRVLERRMQIA